MIESTLSRRAFIGGAGAALALLGGTPMARGASPGALRDQFLLDPDRTYLNNGSLGPSPKPVLDRAMATWRKLERDPVGQNWGVIALEAELVRDEAAKFIGCGNNELAVTRNTTEAMNAVAQGVQLEAGDRVVTTDQEHPGGLVGWQYHAKHDGIVIDTVWLPAQPKSDQQIVDLFAAKLTPKTKVISVSHVTHTTGFRLPIRALADLAESRDLLLVVDGAQVPGVLEVNVRDLGCHTYATSAHKWMLAPKGTGLLYIHENARDRVRPNLLQDGPSIYTASTGTRDLPSIVGLGAAIDFLTDLGKRRIEDHVFALRNQLITGVRRLPGTSIASPRQRRYASALLTIGLPKSRNPSILCRRLRDRHQVVVKALPRGLRVSLHIYSTPGDVDRLLAALRTELT